MKIVINNTEYEIYVKETYMDENKEFKEDILLLEDWAEMVRKKAISTLYYVEDILSESLKRPIRLSEDYPEVKKPVLNFCGSVSRLPNNLIIKPLSCSGGDETDIKTS